VAKFNNYFWPLVCPVARAIGLDSVRLTPRDSQRIADCRDELPVSPLSSAISASGYAKKVFATPFLARWNAIW
jgi:hypothetical protein